MELTINESIYCMQSYLPSDEYTHCTECKYYGCKDNNTCASSEAHQMAVDTMRKYQEIKQLIDDWNNIGQEDDPINVLDNIMEVIENENVN